MTHVPLHCTAWINKESPGACFKHRQLHISHAQTLCFWRGFSCEEKQAPKKLTPEDNSWRLRRSWLRGFVLFFSLFLHFFSCLPSSFSLTFLDRFVGSFSGVERDPEEAEFSALSWSPPSLSLPDRLPPSGSHHKRSTGTGATLNNFRCAFATIKLPFDSQNGSQMSLTQQ